MAWHNWPNAPPKCLSPKRRAGDPVVLAEHRRIGQLATERRFSACSQEQTRARRGAPGILRLRQSLPPAADANPEMAMRHVGRWAALVLLVLSAGRGRGARGAE